MSPAVLLLVAIAAVAHATWNLTIKAAATSGARFLWLTFVVATIAVAPFGIASLVQFGPRMPLLLLLALGSGILQLLYFLTLQRGYRLGDVSIVYPLARGSGPLLSVVFAIVLFGERPGILGLVGAGVVVVGVVVIGLTGGRDRFRANRTGIFYGLLVAPAREASVVLVALAGWLLFREPHPVQRVLGAMVVLGGVALLAIG